MGERGTDGEIWQPPITPAKRRSRNHTGLPTRLQSHIKEWAAAGEAGPRRVRSRPTERIYYGHLPRSLHYQTRLPTVAASPDAVRRTASAPFASTRRAGMGAAGFRHTRPSSATGGLSQVQQEFRYEIGRASCRER